jgi:hypothetical protein
MAAWQYSMHLVPRSELARLVPSLSGALPGAAFDEADWWSTSQPPEDFAERLSTVLPETNGWDRAARVWGVDDGNHVSVGYYASGQAGIGRISDFHARLDLRDPRAEVLTCLVRLGEACDGWWITGDSVARVLAGQQYDGVLDSIRKSNASRFVRDPEAFLRSLSQQMK